MTFFLNFSKFFLPKAAPYSDLTSSDLCEHLYCQPPSPPPTPQQISLFFHIFELVMTNINTNTIQIVTDTNTKNHEHLHCHATLPYLTPSLSLCSSTFSLSSFILQQSSKSQKRILCHQTHASHLAFLLLKSLEKITLMP